MNNSSRGTDKRYTNAVLAGLANLLNYRVLLIQELPENIYNIQNLQSIFSPKSFSPKSKEAKQLFNTKKYYYFCSATPPIADLTLRVRPRVGFYHLAAGLICATPLLRAKVFSLPVPVGQVSFVVRLPYVTDCSIITQFEKGIELLGSC